MGSKALRYALAIVVIALLAYKSVYFRKLDQKAEATAQRAFDAKAYAADYLHKKIPALIATPDGCPDIRVVFEELRKNYGEAFEKYARSPTNGDVGYFLVKGEGNVGATDAGKTTATVTFDNGAVILSTKYIFGNTVRDASGLISADEFQNTMEMNDVSAEINKLITKEVLPPVSGALKRGNRVSFIGCFELKKVSESPTHPLGDISLVPIKIELKK